MAAPLVPVWLDSWQYECCGEPFAVGDRVHWTLRPADLRYLAPPLGPLLPGWFADDLPLLAPPIRRWSAVAIWPSSSNRGSHTGWGCSPRSTTARSRAAHPRPRAPSPRSGSCGGGGPAGARCPASAELRDVAEVGRAAGGAGLLVELAVRYRTSRFR